MSQSSRTKESFTRNIERSTNTKNLQIQRACGLRECGSAPGTRQEIRGTISRFLFTFPPLRLFTMEIAPFPRLLPACEVCSAADFASQNPFRLRLDTSEIPSVDKTEQLGVIVNHLLRWSDHIQGLRQRTQYKINLPSSDACFPLWVH